MDTSLLILSVLLVLLLALIVGGYYFYQRLLDLVDALREHNLVQSDILDFYGAYYERQVAWREEDKAKRSHHKKSAPSVTTDEEIKKIFLEVEPQYSKTNKKLADMSNDEQYAPTEVLTPEKTNHDAA